MFTHSFLSRRVLKIAMVGLLLTGVAAQPLLAAAPAASDPADPDKVNFVAEKLDYDDQNQVIVASGNVEVDQDGKIVKAQKITYLLAEEKVVAEGDVVMMEPDGNVHFADRVELQDRFKNGYVRKLRSVLADGSRFTAEEGRRINGERIIMKDASYTPCEPCKAHPEKDPIWQIKAGRVEHDEVQHKITYDHARFEVSGVPIAYTPFFSHPDGTVNQKSGFLTPSFSMGSQNGFGVKERYYWALSPSEDATFGLQAFTQQTPLLSTEYRRRFENAEIQLDGSTTYSSRIDNVGTTSVAKGDSLRGHLFGKGLWDIDDQWRAGFKTQIASDDQYLRQYGISSDSVLDNEVYAERFEGRNYLVGRALAFQDLRVSTRSTDQPNILPEIEASFVGDPNAALGGRWSLDMSGLGLARKGNGQDVLRGSITGGWERRDVTRFGLVNTFNALARGDIYGVADGDNSSAVTRSQTTAARLYPLIHDVVSMPFAKTVSSAQIVVEPTVALTAATNVKNTGKIPNEDSQDVQVDATNIFSPNRFPGLDRVEDLSHVTYGARTGIYALDGSRGEVFLGQSYRFSNHDNPFPNGSGLSQQDSDFVGQVIADYKKKYGLNYRFDLDGDNFQPQRHELNGYANWDKVSLSTTYLFARALSGTDLNANREQLYGYGSYLFQPDWKVHSAARYDLGEQQGLRNAEIGLQYLGQCVNLSATAKRNFSYDSTGTNATEVMFQVGLKNLGEFGNGKK